MPTEAFERRIEWRPAFDKRDADPNKNYGIGAMKLVFIVIGPKGAVQWMMSTQWYPKHTIPMLRESSRSFEARHGYPLDDWYQPKGFDLGYHAKEPRYEGQTPMDHCDLLGDGKCFYDGSSLQAEYVVDGFVTGGPEWLWPKLEDYYRYTFEDGPYPFSAEAA